MEETGSIMMQSGVVPLGEVPLDEALENRRLHQDTGKDAYVQIRLMSHVGSEPRRSACVHVPHEEFRN